MSKNKGRDIIPPPSCCLISAVPRHLKGNGSWLMGTEIAVGSVSMGSLVECGSYREMNGYVLNLARFPTPHRSTVRLQPATYRSPVG